MPHRDDDLTSVNPDTRAITAGRTDSHALAPSLVPSTVWTTDGMDDTTTRATAHRASEFYGRYANPTVAQFESAIAELEGAQAAIAFGSGMGAIASVIYSFCGSGSHIVAQSSLYGGTLALLDGPCRRFGIDTTFVDASTPGALAAAVQPGRTMLVVAETPSNPRLALASLAELGAIRGPFTVVDSTMATPLGQRPLDHGVDLVLHSATKGIGGHNDALIGVVAGTRELVDAVWEYAVLHGASASPFDALNALRGIRTLPVRLQRQSESALAISRALSSHPRVAEVMYPFLDSHPQHSLAREQMSYGGSMLSFELSGGANAARTFLNGLSLIHPATSFGGPETLVCHPRSSTHVGLPEKVLDATGVTPGLVRMSVGLEHTDDILGDITRALDAVSS